MSRPKLDSFCEIATHNWLVMACWATSVRAMSTLTLSEFQRFSGILIKSTPRDRKKLLTLSTERIAEIHKT